jgi:two-component system response regulator ChvI
MPSEPSPTPRETDGEGARVVVVDDDAMFRESLGLNLADSGYDVLDFDNGRDALAYFEGGGEADVVLLDWRMPGIDGLEVLRRLRERQIDIPVIFLTVVDDEIYEEAALEGGAVDFIDKSRRLSIVLKRISIITEGRKAGTITGEAAHSAASGRLQINHDTKRAMWDGQLVNLTLTEFNIVALLVERVGGDVSYREIYDLVHGRGFYAGSGSEGFRVNVRTFIKRIRSKFKEIDESFDYIENYPGFGYRWRPG